MTKPGTKLVPVYGLQAPSEYVGYVKYEDTASLRVSYKEGVHVLKRANGDLFLVSQLGWVNWKPAPVAVVGEKWRAGTSGDVWTVDSVTDKTVTLIMDGEVRLTPFAEYVENFAKDWKKVSS